MNELITLQAIEDAAVDMVLDQSVKIAEFVERSTKRLMREHDKCEKRLDAGGLSDEEFYHTRGQKMAYDFLTKIYTQIWDEINEEDES